MMASQNDKDVYTSSDLLRHAGISYRQLYHWENKGLLRPYRIRLGSREFKRYRQKDFQIVKLIRDLLDEGYALPNVKMLELILRRKKLEEDLKFRLRIEEALCRVSDSFISPQDLDESVKRSLKILGEVIGVNRVYVFEFFHDGKKMGNTYEVCFGAEPQIQNLQDLSSDSVPWWMTRLEQREDIIVPDVSQIEDDTVRNILQMQDIKSLLVVPMFDGDNLFGFIGFDDTVKTKEWKRHDIKILKTAADILTRGIIYHRNRKRDYNKEKELCF
ncbi:MAG: MerR family transcriptional regulator [Candidatus Aureabacteria bacterium]|nr:MerR family transcriptional regulator [Candidatus Auribacterota bacterium]